MVRGQLLKVLKDLSGEKEIHLEFPERQEHGDYTTNIAMIMAKKEDKNPREYAQELVKKLSQVASLMAFVSKIEMAGPGFINFFLQEEYIVKKIVEIDETYGTSIENEGKEVIVEYSSPNIAKPFGVGHLRSTIIGDCIANLLEATGWKVYRDNHLGDWGTQFGKQIYAIKAWGNEEDLDKSTKPIKDLVALYVKFHEEAQKDPSLEEGARKWFKKLEEGDSEAKRLWKKCIDWSFKEFSKLYQKLGVSFTENNGLGYGESYFEDKMQPIIIELQEKGFLKESQGAKLLFFPKDKYPPLMILKKDGATLYATRDLATDKFRLEKYGKDILVINEVGGEQSLYWKQVFETEYLLGWYKKGQRIHIGHGMIRLKTGKMSTRKGTTILLEDILDEAVKRATTLAKDGQIENLNKVSQQVGMGAIKWNDLKRDYKQDILFDWDEILNMQGNSGPYIQYTYARTQSILAKSTLQGVTLQETEGLEAEELSVAKHLVKFPEIVSFAAINYSPNLLCNYLFELAQKFNTFYNKHKVIGSQKEEYRLLLTKATGQVLKNGLNLLGIETPKRM